MKKKESFEEESSYILCNSNYIQQLLNKQGLNIKKV